MDSALSIEIGHCQLPRGRRHHPRSRRQYAADPASGCNDLRMPGGQGRIAAPKRQVTHPRVEHEQPPKRDAPRRPIAQFIPGTSHCALLKFTDL